jgi:hypothetical protein
MESNTECRAISVAFRVRQGTITSWVELAAEFCCLLTQRMSCVFSSCDVVFRFFNEITLLASYIWLVLNLYRPLMLIATRNEISTINGNANTFFLSLSHTSLPPVTLCKYMSLFLLLHNIKTACYFNFKNTY